MKKLKRFIAACFAMNGILSHQGHDVKRAGTFYLIKTSYTLADELLKQENK